MIKMIEKVDSFIRENNLINENDSVILCVSGGADSVCMLVVLNELQQRLSLKLCAVTVNHMLRGAQSDGDEEFVEKLCGELGIKCLEYRADVADLARKSGIGTEEAGRKFRYDCFIDAAKKEGANKIALAHNADDSAETVLLNLFRGSGIKGLCGIPPKRPSRADGVTIIRPLLCVPRARIEEFLDERGISFRTDMTNLTDDYARNRIRRNVMPYVSQQINSAAPANVLRSARQLSEIEDFLDVCLQGAFAECVEETCADAGAAGEEEIRENGGAAGLLVKRNEWGKLHPAIRSRLIRECIGRTAGRLKDVTEKHVALCERLFDLQTGKKISLPYGVAARRTYDGVLFVREGDHGSRKCGPGTREENRGSLAGKTGTQAVASGETAFTIKKGSLSEKPFEVKTPFGMFEFVLSDRGAVNEIPDLRYAKWLDYDKITGDILIRTRRPGDRIVINKNGGTKKLKDLFIDEKVPAEQRDKTALVVCGGRVLWVVGGRLGGDVYVGPATKRVLMIRYNN